MEENNNQNQNLNNNQNPVVEPVVNQNTTTNSVGKNSTNTSTNPNPYQTAPKAANKNTGLIVVIIILILIIIGGGVYGFITINDLNKKIEEKDEQLSSKTASDTLGSLMDVFNKDKDKEDEDDDKDDDSDKLKNIISKDDDKDKEKDDDDEKNDDINPSSVSAKTSTKEAPLSLGEWGLAAKYVSKNLSKDYEGKSYTDVPVRVTKVTRGSEAETKVKEWFNNQTFYKYQDPKEGTEWAVVDYEVDLSKVSFDEGTIGTSTEVSSAVKGLDGLGVKYNGYSYILSTTNTSSKDYVKKPGVYKCQFIVTLPKGCTEYFVVLGNSHNGAESYFRCEK